MIAWAERSGFLSRSIPLNLGLGMEINRTNPIRISNPTRVDALRDRRSRCSITSFAAIVAWCETGWVMVYMIGNYRIPC